MSNERTLGLFCYLFTKMFVGTNDSAKKKQLLVLTGSSMFPKEFYSIIGLQFDQVGSGYIVAQIMI